MKCLYCENGTIPGNERYLAHKCPDCHGTGQVEECEECGGWYPAGDLQNGICAICVEIKQPENE